jgi:hypothetical protein
MYIGRVALCNRNCHFEGSFKVEMSVMYSRPSIQLDQNMASSPKKGKPIENILAGALAN